ncbi:hypothetical protein PC116_g32549 [Phytophthora cactorum]|nr:hypothetical protein PC116_g32549 [Phytophthora cactorum]
MEFRRTAQHHRDVDESDDEEAVIYVEGEESDADIVNGDMDLDDDDDGLPVTNGVINDDSEDEESSEGEEDDEDLDGQEDLDENDVNHEDVESEEEDSEAEVAEAQRPAKRSRTRRR